MTMMVALVAAVAAATAQPNNKWIDKNQLRVEKFFFLITATTGTIAIVVVHCCGADSQVCFFAMAFHCNSSFSHISLTIAFSFFILFVTYIHTCIYIERLL